MSKGRLYGVGELADRFGVSRQRAYVISRSKGFPDSYDDLQGGSVWLVEDVERWARENRPDADES